MAAPVKLLLMDVDGVLTDGKLINVPDAAGNMVETKAFDSQDGIALQWLCWKGIKTGLISGRVSPATVERGPRGRGADSQGPGMLGGDTAKVRDFADAGPSDRLRGVGVPIKTRPRK